MFTPGVVTRSVRSNTAGSKIATTTRNSNVDSRLALAWLKVCRVRPIPPTKAEMPRNSKVVPMIEPVICAWTIRVFARERTKRASISSAVLPKLMLSSPPIVLPARSASCSVARRSQSASTAMAAAPVRKTQPAGASKM